MKKDSTEFYPTPAHLRDLLVSDPNSSDAHELHGVIRCPCGSAVSSLLYVAELTESQGIPLLRVLELPAGFFLRIGARCMACSRTHLLFDDDYHGWNGFVCPSRGARERARPLYQTYACHRCKAESHQISVGILGDKDQGEMLEDADGVLDQSNWFEGFGWFTVEITCVSCGYGPVAVVDYETR
jgi:hypothetical protein